MLKRIDPPHSESINAVSRMTDGIEMIIVVIWKNALTTVPMPVRYMWCAQTMKLERARAPRRPSSCDPERIAGVVRITCNDPDPRQDEHVNFGMREEPKQVLPQQRAAAAAHQDGCPATGKAGRQEKADASQAVHQLHDGGGLERREREQEQERGHELRPDEERQPHPGHSLARAAG